APGTSRWSGSRTRRSWTGPPPPSGPSWPRSPPCGTDRERLRRRGGARGPWGSAAVSRLVSGQIALVGRFGFRRAQRPAAIGGAQDADRMVRRSPRLLLQLQSGQRAIAGDHVGLGALDPARRALGDLQALREELALHPPGAVHPAAAVDQRDVGARPLEQVAPAVAEVLH